MDDDGTGPYKWVKYIYIDDPISSLDEHNAITRSQTIWCSYSGKRRISSRRSSPLTTLLFFNCAVQ